MYQSTHTGAQVDAAVDKVLASPISMMSNRNLLDNWYFVGGGSQQGGGQFPINQRGQTSYSGGSSYGIDRWRISGNSGSYSLTSAGMVISGGADTLLEKSRVQLGKVYAISALFADGTLLSASGTLSDFSGATNWMITAGVVGEVGIAIRGSSINGNSVFQLVVWNNVADNALAAAKLELGSVSTLANDAPPCFAEELAKCQRYCFVPQIPSGSPYLAPGFNLGSTSSSTLNALITTPVIMRGTPTASGSLHSIRGNGVNINSGISIGTAQAPIGNTVIVPITTSSSFSALTMGYGVLFSSLVLSADL